MPGSLAASSPIARPNSRRRSSTPSRTKQAGLAGQASWLSSVINLVNTIVGAGVLAMPLAMAHMGMVLGILVIIWSGIASGFGLYLQTRCARYLDRGHASFFATSQITYPNIAVIFDAAIAIKCFGVGVSYLIIIGDLMPGVVLGFTDKKDVVPFMVDRHFWVTAFMLVVIPLSFLRRLDSLKYTSVIALISIGYLVILVVYHFAAKDTISHYTSPLLIFHWAGAIPALSSFPVIVFAYTCHQNMFSVINEIQDNSHLQLTSVIVASIGSAAATYILVAVTGYLSFGNEIKGNIVAQYKPSVSATIGRAAIVVLVMFSYPLQVHPCRASVDAVLKWRPNMKRFRPSSNRFVSGSNSGFSSSSDSSPPRDTPLLHPARQKPKNEISETRFAAITTMIIVLSYVVAMTVSSLEAVLAYVGSTGSTSISFILPGLLYYKISSPDSPLHQRLIKEEDDWDDDNDEDLPSATARGHRGIDAEQHVGENNSHRQQNHGESDSLLISSNSANHLPNTASTLRKQRQWRRKTLRRFSLALAIYGIIVMIVCLTVNTVFVVKR